MILICRISYCVLSFSDYLYMDTICGKSLDLKNYASGLDLNLTKSDAYAAELNCTLKLIARTQHRVIVRFISLNIASFVSCPEDYLTISECAPGDNCSGEWCLLDTSGHQELNVITEGLDPSWTSISVLEGHLRATS